MATTTRAVRVPAAPVAPPPATDAAASPTRAQLRTAALLGLTVVVAWLCWLVARPYVSALVWAAALAIVTAPLHRAIGRRVRREGLAAGLAVAVVAIGIVAPTLFVGQQVFAQATRGVEELQSQASSGGWKQKLEANPRLAPLLRVMERQGGNPVEQAARTVGGLVPRVLSISGRGLMEAAITLFALFFLYRDRRDALRAIRGFLPLTAAEAKRVMRRVRDTVWATIYGTVLVAMVQGVLGGLMFWWLGLPAPILWGFVMALLAIIPVLGAFIVWVPAAVVLVLQGEVVKGVILVAWGALVVGTCDNLLYPTLVGRRMRLHTLPVFIALLGGLHLVGAVGIVVGPVLLALAVELRTVWRRRGEARLAGAGASLPAAPRA